LKTYKHLLEQIADKDNVRKAILNASKRKRHRKDVKQVIENIDYHVEVVHNMLLAGSYKAHVDAPCIVNEGTHHKVRRIRKPHYKYDQIIHHCIIQVLQPILTAPMYEYSCGSIPKRGAHYGKRRLEKWIRNDAKGTKYVFKMDIKHFYESVDQDVLKSMLKAKIKDWRALELIYTVIDSCEKGLPLGNYTSQWFANFMLTPLDHYIKEQLHAKYYMRYMDDIVILGGNKKELHKIHKAIEKYLSERLHLRIKENWQVFRLVYTDRNGRQRGRSLDFMGWQFYREKTILRESIYLRIVRKARHVGKHTTIQGAQGMISYMGYIKHTDCYGTYRDYIRPYVNIGKLKKFTSKRAKKGVLKNGVEKSDRNADNTASSTRPRQQP
jgi:hypothetical protein